MSGIPQEFLQQFGILVNQGLGLCFCSPAGGGKGELTQEEASDKLREGTVAVGSGSQVLSGHKQRLLPPQRPVSLQP